MSLMTTLKLPSLGVVKKCLSIQCIMHQQVRTKWANWLMLRDYKRRKVVKQYADDRLRINAIRKNDILPATLREIADEEIVSRFPRDSYRSRLTDRCAITSRPRGNVQPWRLSRIVWRDLADRNKLAGVQRAMW